MFGMTKKQGIVCSKCNAKFGSMMEMEKHKKDYHSLPKMHMMHGKKIKK